MKKLLSIMFILVFASIANAQVYKTQNIVTVGTLSTLLTATEKATITNLKLTGNIDATDFKCLRDELTLLAVLDISSVTIKAYNGTAGPNQYVSSYPDNEIPLYSFSVYGKPKTSLKTVILPTSISSIGIGAFSDCTSLTAITLPNSLISIKENGFNYCKSLTSITIPSSVTRIESGVFTGCTNLNSVTIRNPTISIIPNDTSSNTYTVFHDCSKIDTLRIANLKDLSRIFENYAFISKVEILDGNDVIPTSTFEGWRNLKYITLPATLKVVDISAFEECRNLQSVKFKEGTTRINDYAFYNCRAINELVLPTTLTEIGISSFESCRSITTLSLQSKLTTIGGSAFWGCTGLTNLTFDSNLTTIGDAAFWGCYKVNSIISKSLVPPTLSGVQVFGGVDKSICELTVPQSAIASYKVAPQWKDFIFKSASGTNDIQNDKPTLYAYCANGNLNINSSVDMSSICAYGTNGQVVTHIYNLGKSAVFPIDKHGVYFLKVQLSDNSIQTLKIINQK